MIKIIGIGNKLMGDDSIGLIVLERIKENIKKINKEIEIIFGETDFIYCLNKVNNKDLVIILDSTYFGIQPGTVSTIYPHRIKHYNKYSVTQHEMTLTTVLLDEKKDCKVYIIGIEIIDCTIRIGISESLLIIIDQIGANVLKEIENIYHRGI